MALTIPIPAACADDLMPIVTVTHTLTHNTEMMFNILKPLDTSSLLHNNYTLNSHNQPSTPTPTTTRTFRTYTTTGSRRKSTSSLPTSLRTSPTNLASSSSTTSSTLEDFPDLSEALYHMDHSPAIHDDRIKPSIPFACLIAMAILESEDKKLTVAEIYDWLRDNFPYFLTSAAGAGWKNSVRHNLSLNKNFEKIQREENGTTFSKGASWTINSNSLRAMLDIVHRSSLTNIQRFGGSPPATVDESGRPIPVVTKPRYKPRRRTVDFVESPDDAANVLLAMQRHGQAGVDASSSSRSIAALLALHGEDMTLAKRERLDNQDHEPPQETPLLPTTHAATPPSDEDAFMDDAEATSNTVIVETPARRRATLPLPESTPDFAFASLPESRLNDAALSARRKLSLPPHEATAADMDTHDDEMSATAALLCLATQASQL